MTPKTIEALAEEHGTLYEDDPQLRGCIDVATASYLAGAAAQMKLLAEGTEGHPPRVWIFGDGESESYWDISPEGGHDGEEHVHIDEFRATVARHLAEAASLREVLQRCLQFASCRNYSRAEVEECIRSEIAAFRASETEQKEGGNG